MGKTYNIFKTSVKNITDYYMLLVEETKSQCLVGSTNEWVLDNYYMISEQEKVLRVDLKSNNFRRLDAIRTKQVWDVLHAYLEKCHYQIGKQLLFRYIRHVQVKYADYLSYPEVYALLPLLKTILISELSNLCAQLRTSGAYHYSPTDKANFDDESLNTAAACNLKMMNIFNSLKLMTRLPMAELIDAVSFSEQMLKGEKAAMYDQMYDKTKDDYRDRIIRLCKKTGKKEYDLVKELVAAANEKGQHVGWQLFPPICAPASTSPSSPRPRCCWQLPLPCSS